MVRMQNLRLGITFSQALEMHLGTGYYMLDAYNNKVFAEGFSFAVTTRISADNNHWLMEVYE